jgi:hypothetical protein
VVLPPVHVGQSTASLSLDELTAGGPAVVVFAHADCPTSTLALRRLANVRAADGLTLACIAEETPVRAAQLARRTGIRFPVLSEPAPYEVSRAYGVETVPTAVRIEPGAGITGNVVGWDLERYGRCSAPRFPPKIRYASLGAARAGRTRPLAGSTSSRTCSSAAGATGFRSCRRRPSASR